MKGKTRVPAILISALLISLSIGAAQSPYNSVVPDPSEIHRDIDFSNYPNCHQEGKYWLCRKYTTKRNVSIKFKGPITCYASNKTHCQGNASEEMDIGCEGTIEVTEETPIKVNYQKYNSSDLIEELKKEVVLEEGAEKEVIIFPSQVDCKKCQQVAVDEEESLFVGYQEECDYEGESYEAKLIYNPDGLILYDLKEPPEEGLGLPSPYVLLLIALIIGAALWVIYPKIKKREGGKQNE